MIEIGTRDLLPIYKLPKFWPQPKSNPESGLSSNGEEVEDEEDDDSVRELLLRSRGTGQKL